MSIVIIAYATGVLAGIWVGYRRGYERGADGYPPAPFTFIR